MASSSETNASGDQTDGDPKLSQTRLYICGLAISVTNLTVAFDTTILGPAIPTITSEFGTLNHIGWYTSAYLLGMVCCQPFFARLILYYEKKWFYMTCVLVLEVGSIICATAPSSPVLIFGRAISGCGAAGITAGAFALVGQLAPLRERPRLIAMFTALQALAYSSGPTISGAFTGSSVTWRFNFWINLPIGFVSLVFVWFAVPATANVKKALPLLEKLKRCDLLGASLLILCLVPQFLALEWGGNVAPFSSPRVWGCFLASGIFALGFAALLAIKKDK
ncbi:putative HC-toxin efflux carrier-like protein [Hapsidospora chrysogenum ATCC 11550]|uniref:Putative HC-toxin efflux carrier-like protein n=1 Tax=Hapsidospora chrysogenum (strain ATCC 11550 / CBS 779.69 / DSM 880 / IAM 14645 / JCM 23072 / IMI 49137) TaxID=857340 RepID=A0A086TBA2_HAPC1|nr:putative HC-toxin efflux carrier-like protein [Hapsidospora chrysogenum ATCC 11550]